MISHNTLFATILLSATAMHSPALASTDGEVAYATDRGCDAVGCSTMRHAPAMDFERATILEGNCTSYSLSPSSLTISPVAGTNSFFVNVPDGCGYFATPGNCTSWIGDVVSGPSGLVTFFAMGNSSCFSRSCTMNVMNQLGQQVASLNVTQQGLGAIPQPTQIQGPSTFCAPAPAQYSVNPITIATAFDWTFSGDGTPTGTGTTITFTPLSSGTLTVVATNSCGSGQPRHLEITFLDPPNMPGAITGDEGTCGDETLQFDIDPVDGASGYTWTFSGPGVPVGNGTNMSFVPGGPGTLSVIATNVCGSSEAATTEVDVLALPAQAQEINGPAQICPGGTYTFSVTELQGADSYIWTLPSDWAGSSDSSAIVVTIGTSGGTIDVVGSNSCGTGPSTSLTMAIPSLELGAITGPTGICVSTTTTYSVEALDGDVSYIWTLPPSWTGSSDSASIDITVGAASGTVQVQAQDACVSSNVASLNVASIPLPARPSLINGTFNVCTGTTHIYDVASSPDATSYEWELPHPSWSGQSSGISISVTAGTSPGLIKVSALNQCGTSPPREAFVGLLPSPAPVAPITGDLEPCVNDLNTYSASQVSGMQYLWTMTGATQGGTTTSSNSVDITFIQEGPQTISVRSNTACGNGPLTSLTVNAQVCSNVEEHGGASNWNLYPNPAGPVLFLEHGGNGPGGQVSIDVIDATGRSVGHIGRRSTHYSGERLELHTSTLGQGSYFLRVQHNDRMVMLPFLKL